MAHLLDTIADAIVDLIVEAETAAGENVHRDREPPLEVRSELPAVVVHIGEDDPVDNQVHGAWRSDARINIDLFASAPEAEISSTLLGLRAETYAAVMADTRLGLDCVIRTIPGGAEEILRGEGSVPVGYLRTTFFVLYQHSFDDAAAEA